LNRDASGPSALKRAPPSMLKEANWISGGKSGRLKMFAAKKGESRKRGRERSMPRRSSKTIAVDKMFLIFSCLFSRFWALGTAVRS